MVVAPEAGLRRGRGGGAIALLATERQITGRVAPGLVEGVVVEVREVENLQRGGACVMTMLKQPVTKRHVNNHTYLVPVGVS